MLYQHSTSFFIVIGFLHLYFTYSYKCNIPRVNIITDKSIEILNDLPPYPIIYQLPNKTDVKGKLLRKLTELSYLLEHHGEDDVTLSSSNAYSHGKHNCKLKEYLSIFNKEDEMTDMLVNNHANESYYLFGYNYEGIWKQISTNYIINNCQHCEEVGAKTVGIGANNSGVVFHFHGPGFAEVLYGAKQWFFYPPKVEIPGFNPDMAMTEWVSMYNNENNNDANERLNDTEIDIDSTLDGYMRYTETNHIRGKGSNKYNSNVKELLLECVLYPNELLYFPSNWNHGTLNIGEYNVFVSTFVDNMWLDRLITQKQDKY